MRALALVLLVAGCGPTSALDRGRALFADPRFSPSNANTFACATCHATTEGPLAWPTPDAGPNASARRDPGYSMHGVLARGAWWGGAYTSLLDAVNECYEGFMGGTPLPADDVDGHALLVYLRSLGPDSPAAPLPMTVVRNIADVPKGDAARGRPLYAAACARCHGEPPTAARLITIEKIRHGRYFGVGGRMPLFSEEVLSDGEVGDLLAWLGR